MSHVVDAYRVKAILFDIDGTLADTDDVYVRRLARLMRPIRRLFREHNPTPFARWLVMLADTPTNGFVTFIDRMGLDNILAPIYNTIRSWRGGFHPDSIALMPGILSVLLYLHLQYPLAIVTTRSSQSTKEFLDRCRLIGLFQAVATIRTCRRTKPHPDPVRWAAEMLGVDPHECLMVGDTSVDIRAGLSAGAQTVGVLCGFGDKRELERAGADCILSRTTELIDVLT
jgi:phosphoglycolate phosphatase-like HAD superfamily hydrolase